MAAVPVCALCKAPEIISKYLENRKKHFLKFSIFIILVIEWFSIFYNKTYTHPKHNIYDSYLMYYYPLLTQLALFVIFFSIFLWKDRLHFCFRKAATTFYLSLYYLLGVLSVLLCLSADFYYEAISIGSLAIASFIFIVSLLRSSIWKNT
jgi:hypothetical protein